MFTLEEAVTAVGGRLIIGSDYKMNEQISISGVSKDTRTINEGEMYVALVGENFDGHSFCSNALEKGASVLLVSDVSYLPTKSLAILVDDTKKALGLLARHYRFKLGCKVVAITGSVGKTTTREMVCAGLKDSLRVFSTEKNLNNDIGLPMTILSAPEDTQVLVLEMGMRLRGEIEYLTGVACPDIAIITNVGYSHIERLGSQKEIMLAKFEIVDGLVAGGVLAINGDNKDVAAFAQENVSIANPIAVVNIDERASVSNFAMTVRAENIRMGPKGTSFDVYIENAMSGTAVTNVKLKTPGVHMVRNAMFSFICAAALGVDFSKVREGLESYENLEGRGLIMDDGDITVIDDAYNAAPESMEAAFENLNLMEAPGRKIAVLGGMLELGDYSDLLHEKVGESAGKYDFDRFFVTGDDAEAFISGLHKVNPEAKADVFKTTEELEKALREYITAGDTILFKASNAFKFQALAKRISEEHKA